MVLDRAGKLVMEDDVLADSGSSVDLVTSTCDHLVIGGFADRDWLIAGVWIHIAPEDVDGARLRPAS